MLRDSWLIGSAALLLLATGCGNGGPDRSPIKGKITIGGHPLAAGKILFIPQAPTVGPATSAAIKNGEYALPKDDGPIVGMHRVEIEAELPLGFAIDDDAAFAARKGKPLPPNPVPPLYNRQSTLTYEVQPKVENEFTFDIPVARR